jgi:hypothetical protein
MRSHLPHPLTLLSATKLAAIALGFEQDYIPVKLRVVKQDFAMTMPVDAPLKYD